MVIFMKKGGVYLDLRILENVNIIYLQGSITVVDFRGYKYQLVEDRSNIFRRYDVGFFFFFFRIVLRLDFIYVFNVFKEIWIQIGWFIIGIFNILKLEILFL